VNGYGETFEEKPPPGEYLTCPLVDCKWKLAQPSPARLVRMGSELVRQVGATVSINDAVRESIAAVYAQQEVLIKAHLKTHALVDFYRTRAHILTEAHREADKITELAARVFLSQATQGQAKGGA